VTAVDGGRSVATSMGLTRWRAGMGTRSGSIDRASCLPAARGYLTEKTGWPIAGPHSGLVGPGRTSDVRELLALEAGDGLPWP
jgi:acetate kinase